jgi:ribonucleoside-diphosphate reductase alpha chain
MSRSPFDTPFAHNIYTARYEHPDDGGWTGTSARVAGSVMGALKPTLRFSQSQIDDATDRIFQLFNSRQALPGGRYLYAAGRDLHQVNNCVLLRCPDDREGWARTSYQAEMALMTGAGIGGWYGDVRPGGVLIKRTGGTASGPLPKMQQVNETGRHTMQGGNRRSAIWAGLPWWHADIFDFIKIKDWSDEIKAMKAKDWTFPAACDMTNISVTLDDAFFDCYTGRDCVAPKWSEPVGQYVVATLAPDGGTWHDWARRVYDTAVDHMLRHGEPGFTVDTGENAGEVLRNACTEITSSDDSDVCNLGSLVMPRFADPQQFGASLRDLVLFLTAGSVYSDVPYEKVSEIRNLNRRLGAGLIGVHEFLMKAGARYGSDEALTAIEPYMVEYGRALEYAHDVQEKLGLSLSKGATAIAPNGTIGIIAESTPSGDPMFSAAERRQVKSANHNGDTYVEHVVVDPTAKRMVAEGVDPSIIEDAATLSMFPERRLRMQAFMQRYTDHAISSTVNLPYVVTDPAEVKDHGDTLMEYLPHLRGVTYYPDGARAGQPRSPVDLEWALSNEGSVFEVDEETCVGGACGV